MEDTERGEVSLARVFEGWEGYNTSLIRAVGPRSPEELAWRPGEDMRSAGQVAAHIALGRIDWFHRMGAPASVELVEQTGNLSGPAYWALEERLAKDAGEIVTWLEKSWRMVDVTLREWTVADLWETFRQPYGGKVYAVSRQWVLWRIMAHDIHHGGQLTIILGQQGIALPELADLGGHLTEPPLADVPAG